MKSINIFMITGILLIAGQSLQAEDSASLYTIHDSGHGALGADFYSSRYSGAEIARIPGSGYDGRYSGSINKLFLGGNIGIGYNTELLIEVPYIFNSKDIQQFDNGINFEIKESGWTTVTVGAKHRLFISRDRKNEVQIRGYLTSKDAVMQHEEADLSYLHTFSDTTKIALDARYVGVKNGPSTKGINATLMTNIAPNILFIPHLNIMRHDSDYTYSAYNSQEASLSVRFNSNQHWHITPEVFLIHIDQLNTNYYEHNIGAGTARGIGLKIQREY